MTDTTTPHNRKNMLRSYVQIQRITVSQALGAPEFNLALFCQTQSGWRWDSLFWPSDPHQIK